MLHGPCVKCGSANVVKNVRVMDRAGRGEDAGNLTLIVYTNPGTFGFRNSTESPLSAFMCAECGYTELYAVDPRSIAQAAAQAQSERPTV